MTQPIYYWNFNQLLLEHPRQAEYIMKKNKKQYKTYLEFLEARLNSENYKNNVSPEEYKETKEKYDREKFKQRILKK